MTTVKIGETEYEINLEKAVEQGLIKKVEKFVPKILGQRFKYTCWNWGPSEEYILAQTDTREIALIDLKNGNRFTKPVNVKSSSNITEDEWAAITHNNAEYFELMS